MLRIGILAAGVALLAASASQAAVGLSFNAGTIGVTQSVNFNGFTNDFAGGTTALPGLTATVDFRLTAISGNSWSFDYSVANTSSVPVTSSRVSVFGFDVSAPLQSSSATGEFSSIGSGTVPVGRGNRDICFRTGNGGQCAGGGGGGVTIGEAASTGTFMLIFASPTTNVVLSKLFVRYQSLNAPTRGVNTASGVGDVAAATVPEPQTWAMLIGGFAMVGSAMRRRRSAAATA